MATGPRAIQECNYWCLLMFIVYYADSAHTGILPSVTRLGPFPRSARGPGYEANANTPLPPPYLHTGSDQILEVGTAWERGYALA